MPGMDGAELARRMRARFPAITVVFASGYGDAPQPGIDDAYGCPSLARWTT